MSQMEDRGKAFERKHVMDEELRFKIEARTSRLFGLWAAGRLGLDGDAATSYAADVVGANLEEAGFEDIMRKVSKDFSDKKTVVTETDMRAELEKAGQEARRQLAPNN